MSGRGPRFAPGFVGGVLRGVLRGSSRRVPAALDWVGVEVEGVGEDIYWDLVEKPRVVVELAALARAGHARSAEDCARRGLVVIDEGDGFLDGRPDLPTPSIRCRRLPELIALCGQTRAIDRLPVLPGLDVIQGILGRRGAASGSGDEDDPWGGDGRGRDVAPGEDGEPMRTFSSLWMNCTPCLQNNELKYAYLVLGLDTRGLCDWCRGHGSPHWRLIVYLGLFSVSMK